MYERDRETQRDRERLEMAGRNHHTANAMKLREVHLARSHHPALIDEHRRHLQRLSNPPTAAEVVRIANSRPHPSLIEERIVENHREIQSLLGDNQRLAATHVALKQEIAATQQELRHLSVAAADVKVERDAQVREVYERSLKMDAEVRSIDAMNAELAQVRVDTHKLSKVRQELTTEIETIENDLARTRSELQQLPIIKADVDSMHQELQRGRAAIEYEKKTHASNLEHGKVMERNMTLMTREIEKLRAELANAEKRARAAAAAAANPDTGYAASYGNPDMGYGVNPYVDAYAMHQVQGSADAAPQYGSGARPHGPYDMQQPNV